MPRDSKGNPFGIDTRVKTPDGEITVGGFTVLGAPLSKEEINVLARNAGGGKAYFWHEVEVINPDENPYAKHDEHTDTCHVDIAQRGGLSLPEGHDAVRKVLEEHNPLTTGLATKAVWSNYAPIKVG